MIEQLTDAQIAKFPEYVEKWLGIGLDTNEIDVDQSKFWIEKIYANADLPMPTEIMVFDSPNQAIRELKSKGITAGVSDFLYGNQDATWCSYYEYYLKECDIKEVEKIQPYFELAKYCGWWLPFDEAVVLCYKPTKIKFDDRELLHCEDGPAIEFKDGFSIYSWHGVNIPSEWIENKASLTPSMALTWENIEQRRCACEILGWNNILNELDSKVINKDKDPMIGELLEVTLPDIGKEHFLRVTCGTGREFAIPVPPEMKTALEANAWTYGVDPSEYVLELRT